MEGHTLMEDDLRHWAQGYLRMGAAADDIVSALDVVMKELLVLEDYLRAVEEAKFRP
jgi:hypothetical protein